MKPEIFMDDFERTEFGDAHYSAIGRALIFATRFESLCRSLNILLGVKEKCDALNAEKEIDHFVECLHKKQLAKHIKDISANEDQLKDILNKARLARNEIAHEITLGLDRMIDDQPDLIKRLENLSDDIAKADLTISLILSVLTNKILPTPVFLSNYSKLIKEWITDITI